MKIDGDLTLHGVTRRITIPVVVTLNGNNLRAVGEFSIDRDDYQGEGNVSISRSRASERRRSTSSLILLGEERRNTD